MKISSWQSQLRKGAAELVVLSILARGEAYGVEILERANVAGEIVTDGALYPLLSRLEKTGRISGRWSIGEMSASPRKYYRLTDDGQRLVAEMRDIWIGFRATIASIVENQHDA